MRASELAKELEHIIATSGDYELNISCAKPQPEDETEVLRQQRYLISSPLFVVLDDYETGPEISIRDWPY